MDGYAVRASDVAQGAGAPESHRRGRGRPALRAAVGSGEAARIFTGGVMPDGADAIVIQEHTTRDGDRRRGAKAVGQGPPHPRARASTSRAGETLLAAGHRLTARDLALAAGMNHPLVPVHRRPKVALFATGDELVPPGTEPGPGQIVSSNDFALAALARAKAPTSTISASSRDRLDETDRRRAARPRRRRRHSRHDRRRFGRRLRSRAEGVRRRGHGRCRSGRSRCGPAGR